MEIDLDKILEHVKRIAVERPDTKYSPLIDKSTGRRYLYTNGADGHGCLIGEGIKPSHPELYAQLRERVRP